MLIQERAKVKDLTKSAERLKEISSKTLDQNSKLIKWIENILKEFGTCDVRENHVSIPIYRRKTAVYNDDIAPFLSQREYIEIIEIPAITIVKMR